jgi:lysozyme family protein
MTPFERALQQTLGFEGGTGKSPIDRGGFTSRGITQALYDRWRIRKRQDKQSVALMEDAELRAIAMEWFWKPCGCELLPTPLALMVFDMAFNSGQSDAIKALQIAVGAHVDGTLGPETIAKARAADANAPLRLLKARGAHVQETIRDDPLQIGNLEGWIDRLLDQAWTTSKGAPA